MSLPKEPRQLMINLMYLVLTALLAMNVSSEILNAFRIVDRSILRSSKNIDDKTAATIENFKLQLEDPKIKNDPIKFKKVSDYYQLALKATEMRKAIEADLDVYRQMIVDRAGGIDPETNDILRRDDLDAATAIMVEGPKKGEEMKSKLMKFKSELAALVPTGDDIMSLASKNESIERMLPINFDVEESETNVNKDWSYGNFNMVPAVGAVTIMDKYINDVKNSESVVMDELWAKAFGEKVRQQLVFKDYAILISSPNTYLLPGEKYTAQIMLGAYNKTSNNLTIRVNGQNLAVKDGIATFTATASGKGEQTINVAASYADPNEGNAVKNYTAKSSYFVGESQATISLDKMNVFYIGVENPITLSASGIPAGNLSYSAENCTLTKSEGVNKYMVTVASGMAGKKATIRLTGKLSDGTTKDFGTYTYRIKEIPDPYPVIARSRGGSMAGAELRVQEAVFAKLDNFDFEAKFTVVSFDVTYQKKRSTDLEVATSRSQYLTGPNAAKDVEDLVTKVKIGDRIYFENIKAVGPDKRVRTIGSVNFIIAN
jgi:gliding motility-associated protein GldM